MTSLALIFAFMVFMLILNKGHLYFFSVFSLILVAAISLGIGFGIAAFVSMIFESMLSLLPILILVSLAVLIFVKK